MREEKNGTLVYFKLLFTIKEDESEREVTQSCPTLCDPMDYSLPGSSLHEIFQARILEWVAIQHSVYHSCYYLVEEWCTHMAVGK